MDTDWTLHWSVWTESNMELEESIQFSTSKVGNYLYCTHKGYIHTCACLVIVIKSFLYFHACSTPWGELQRPASHLSDIVKEAPASTHTITSNATHSHNQKPIPTNTKSQAQIPVLHEENMAEKEEANQLPDLTDSSSSSNIKPSSLAPLLVDKVGRTVHGIK